MDDLNISHTVLFWGITTLGATSAGVAAYLYRRLDQLKDQIPSKDEIRLLTESINSVSVRLDHLYQALAGQTIKAIGTKKKKSKGATEYGIPRGTR